MSETTERNLLKKITLGTIGAQPDIEKLIEHKNEYGEKAVMPLATIYGVTSSYKAGHSDNTGSDFVRFMGQFKAIRVADKASFVSGQCILPGAAPDMLYGAVNGLGEAGGNVEFAFNIGASFDATAATKYVYHVSQVIESNKDDPLARLENMLNTGGAPALAAVPSKSIDPEADPKAGKKKSA